MSVSEKPACESSAQPVARTVTAGLPAVGGAYLLVMCLAAACDIRVGSLGLTRFRRGWYLYAGSARGPGGLLARCGRHLRQEKTQRWHIDFLTGIAPPRQILFAVDLTEERLVEKLLHSRELKQPVRGFGATDSRASSHLFYSEDFPDISRLTREMSLFVPE